MVNRSSQSFVVTSPVIGRGAMRAVGGRAVVSVDGTLEFEYEKSCRYEVLKPLDVKPSFC